MKYTSIIAQVPRLLNGRDDCATHPGRKTIIKRLSRGWPPDEAAGAVPRAYRKPGPKGSASLRPDYMRGKNAERRARAKAAGICCHCNADESRPNRTTCAGCASVAAHK